MPPLLGGLANPFRSLVIVFRYPCPVVIEHCERVLRLVFTSLRKYPIPLRRLGVILRNVVGAFVDESKRVEHWYMTRLGRFAIPLQSFGNVRRSAEIHLRKR